MNLEAKICWEKEMVFQAHLDGFQFLIDSSPERLQGPKPKGLILISLAGCTGMDVIGILKKMHKKVEAFEVGVRAVVAEDHPKKIRSIHVTYTLSGKDLDAEAVKKAVELSQTKYCGVSATLAPGVEITHEIHINGKPNKG